MTKSTEHEERNRSTWAECLLGTLLILSFGLAAVLDEAGIDLLMRGFMTNFILYVLLLVVAGFG